MYDDLFIDVESLTRGQHVTVLAHPDDPEFYVIELGKPIDRTFGLAAGQVRPRS